jgi:hypothetical protein
MATNMDKAMQEFLLPDDLPPSEVEIELAGDEVEPTEFGDDEPAKADIPFSANLAEHMSEDELLKLATTLVADYETDVTDRKDWLETYNKGMDLLGLKIEEVSEPWPGACGVFHPLLMESAVRFQAETVMETFPSGGPVRTKIIGKETPEKKEAASRVEEDMNYTLLHRMKEYRPEHERMLISLFLAGNAFKKAYFDPVLERPCAPFISAEDVVVPYGASDIDSAERVTHVMRKTENQVAKLQVAGFYRDIELSAPGPALRDSTGKNSGAQATSGILDNRHVLLEMHVDIDLPGFPDVDEANNETGIARPYVVTIERSSNMVLSVYRNWDETDPLKAKRQHFTHYGFVPGFGFYYFGLVHLIGGHAKSATSLLRQLVDAGTLANVPGGFKAKGMRMKNADNPILPGEFRDVDLPSGTIRDNIMPLPYKEPSATLAALMDRVIEDARRYVGATDLKVSDMSSQAPVGTTLAILERSLKVMSAVQARIHYTMQEEFKLLSKIIRDHAPTDYTYDPESGNRQAKQADYDMVEIIPVSDPNASTLSQRVVQYQAVHQLSQTAPHLYDLPQLHRQMIETIGIKNAAKIVPMADDMSPVDPVAENMNMLMGKPMKAFMTQDHDAHLAVHTALLQNPKLAAAMGQNPKAQELTAAMHAHIMEHVAYKYRADIEKQLGAPLPPIPVDDETKLDPNDEIQVSQLAAAAAAKLLGKDVAEARAQQAAEQMKDPMVQMQMQELQNARDEIARKAKKDAADEKLGLMEIALKASGQAATAENQKLGTVLNALGDAADRELAARQAAKKTQTGGE